MQIHTFRSTSAIGIDIDINTGIDIDNNTSSRTSQASKALKSWVLATMRFCIYNSSNFQGVCEFFRHLWGESHVSFENKHQTLKSSIWVRNQRFLSSYRRFIRRLNFLVLYFFLQTWKYLCEPVMQAITHNVKGKWKIDDRKSLNRR